jgi:hypothetical protein
VDTIKETARITRASLEEFLEMIGWSIRFHGANTWRIYSHKRKCTVFQFSSEKPDEPIYELRTSGYQISSSNYHRPFGKGIRYGDGGIVVFLLSHCKMIAIGRQAKADCISISADTADGKNMVFVSFYNHD